MVKQEYIDKLVNIQGFFVYEIEYIQEDNSTVLRIIIKRKECSYRCSCGLECSTYYDSEVREIRDLGYGPYRKVFLVFTQCRINCRTCGIKTELFDWVEPRVHYTMRLGAAVALACEETRSLKSIAEQFGLHWETVKEIDKKALERKVPAVGSQNPVLLAIDEFSIRKRHSYATTVIDVLNSSVLYVGKDRREESLKPFFEALGPEKCGLIKAVAMDMWKPYLKAVKENCPHAAIVFDPFHIIQAFGRDVIDKVRTEEYRKATASVREVIKGSRYILLKNSINLDRSRGEHVRLKDLLHINRKINKVYILKDDLKELWHYKSEAWARKWFKSWYRRAIYSRIEPLKDFAKMLKRHLEGIINHCKYQIHTGMLEGINNKIKVIKRIAYGFRDVEYFFLKIRGAFC
jgi:transposase